MATEQRQQHEPSMEEILSSIRRIIADEDAEGEEGSEAAEERAASGGAPPRGETPETEGQAVGNPDEEADDVLELTKVVRESGEVVDLRGDAGDAERFDADTLDPVEEVEEAELAPPEDAPEEEPDGMTDEHMHQEDEATVHAKQSDADELISTSAATVASGSIAKLNSAFRTPAEESIADVDGRTIEQFAEDMLRPMLKDWLDQHLPPLIERIVEREIRKIARRAETF